MQEHMNSMNAAIRPHCDDAEAAAKASRQLGRQVAVSEVHISSIRAADTVLHQGIVRTVCPRDIGHDAFMGRSLFGDSYVLGRRKVLRIEMAVAGRAA